MRYLQSSVSSLASTYPNFCYLAALLDWIILLAVTLRSVISFHFLSRPQEPNARTSLSITMAKVRKDNPEAKPSSSEIEHVIPVMKMSSVDLHSHVSSSASARGQKEKGIIDTATPSLAEPSMSATTNLAPATKNIHKPSIPLVKHRSLIVALTSTKMRFVGATNSTLLSTPVSEPPTADIPRIVFKNNLRAEEVQCPGQIRQHDMVNVGSADSPGVVIRLGNFDSPNATADQYTLTPMQTANTVSAEATGLTSSDGDRGIDLFGLHKVATDLNILPRAPSLSNQMRLQTESPFEEVGFDMLSIVSPNNRIGGTSAASWLPQRTTDTLFSELYGSAGSSLTKKHQQSKLAGGTPRATGASLTEALGQPSCLSGESNRLSK